MTRFRLDSATAEEALLLSCQAYMAVYFTASAHHRNDRAQRLLLHWWAVGHDPARAIRNRKVGER